MKILYLPAYCFPEHAASSYLGDNRSEAFIKAGYEIEAFAPTPCRGISQEVRKEYKRKKLEKQYDGKYVIHRFSMYSEGKNPLLRALRYTLVCLKQMCIGIQKGKKMDILFLASTPPIQGAMGAVIKKFTGIPFVYNLQDIFPDSLAGTGLAKKGGLVWKIGRVIEDFTYRNADKIIVISEDFKKNIMDKGVLEEKIEIVYNWVDEQAVVDVPRSENRLFDKYGLDRNKFYVTYNGNIGLTQNIDMLVEVAKVLETNTDIHFVLVGEGADKKRLESIIKERNLENITLLPFQPYEDISHVFSLGDVSLVISKPGVGANSVPSKTWSIMSASRPVLANFDENELKSIVENNNCGIFTAAGDKVAFIDAILKLYKDRELCKDMGKNGRKFVMANLTREIGTTKYVNVIKNVATQRKE